jgi:hypothetical protein
MPYQADLASSSCVMQPASDGVGATPQVGAES